MPIDADDSTDAMKPTDELVEKVRAMVEEYCEREGISERQLSTLVLNFHGQVPKLLSGGNLNLDSIRKLEKYLMDAGISPPSDVPKAA